ncbi:hypothetical protein CBR_g54310 [Chara braunii]|uniref:Uncharacterized protein n=1 Tax=Chara braunii TaxID=69332 RepID=A0A388MC23_CHABU|nr:hypothetical protein CBR_g54310 [Chara braunii]|eukprot:GBG92055.1 hypothetical protein CBR_g54310 [Chara braunii]
MAGGARQNEAGAGSFFRGAEGICSPGQKRLRSTTGGLRTPDSEWHAVCFAKSVIDKLQKGAKCTRALLVKLQDELGQLTAQGFTANHDRSSLKEHKQEVLVHLAAEKLLKRRLKKALGMCFTARQIVDKGLEEYWIARREVAENINPVDGKRDLQTAILQNMIEELRFLADEAEATIASVCPGRCRYLRSRCPDTESHDAKEDLGRKEGGRGGIAHHCVPQQNAEKEAEIICSKRNQGFTEAAEQLLHSLTADVQSSEKRQPEASTASSDPGQHRHQSRHSVPLNYVNDSIQRRAGNQQGGGGGRKGGREGGWREEDRGREGGREWGREGGGGGGGGGEGRRGGGGACLLYTSRCV